MRRRMDKYPASCYTAVMSALDLLGRAVEWARSGGSIARDRFGSAVASMKADESVVTDADHAVQQHILDRIAANYPGHAIVVEETVKQPERHREFTAAEWCWVIDPIDGTRNYARGIPCFAVSIGLLHNGSPEVAVLYSVMDDRLYSAYRGGGAWCDGKRLHVVDEPPSGETLLGAPSGKGDPMPQALHKWLDFMAIRNYGAVALHLAYVAAGGMDAAFCLNSKLWDISAGALLVTEAGGVITDLDGNSHFPVKSLPAQGVPKGPIIAAGPNLHRYLLDSWLETR